MLQLLGLAVIIIAISIIDIRSQLKQNLKKEIIPYVLFMLLSGSLGYLYLTDPFRKSIAYFLLAIFHMKE